MRQASSANLSIVGFDNAFVSLPIRSSNEELRPEDLLKDLKEDSSLDDVGYWIEDKRKGMDIYGIIFC